MNGICLVSSAELRFIGTSPSAGLLTWSLPFAALVSPAADETVTIGRWVDDQHPPTHRSVPLLGEALARWYDRKLLATVLQGYFAAVAEELKKAEAETHYRLLPPLWLGRPQLGLLRRVATTCGLQFEQGHERGLELAALHAGRHDPPAAGGWLVADHCPPDLDLYAVRDQRRGERRKLELVDYRRLRGFFASEPPREAELRSLRDALAELPTEWPVLASDERTREVLGKVRARRAGAAPTLVPFEPRSGGEGLALSHALSYWLDHGDARLEALVPARQELPARAMRLLELPDEAPEHLRLSVRAGFSPRPEETREICRLEKSKGDYHSEGGLLMVELGLEASERGQLSVQPIQRRRRIDRWQVAFAAGQEEEMS